MAKKPASAETKNGAATREERLKAALKANLARRKAQNRARAGAKEQKGGESPGQDKDN